MLEIARHKRRSSERHHDLMLSSLWQLSHKGAQLLLCDCRLFQCPQQALLLLDCLVVSKWPYWRLAITYLQPPARKRSFSIFNTLFLLVLVLSLLPPAQYADFPYRPFSSPIYPLSTPYSLLHPSSSLSPSKYLLFVPPGLGQALGVLHGVMGTNSLLRVENPWRHLTHSLPPRA